MSRKYVLLIATIAIVAIVSAAFAAGPIDVDFEDYCLEGSGWYDLVGAARNTGEHPIHVERVFITNPDGSTLDLAINNGIIQPGGSVPYSHKVPNPPHKVFYGLTVMGHIVETDTQVDDTGTAEVSGHCFGPDTTPTDQPTLTPTNEPTLTATNTATVTPSITPTGTVTPGQTVVPTVTPTNTSSPVPSSTPVSEVTPVQEQGASPTPQMSITPCPPTGCLLPDCEWIGSVQNLVIHSGGHNNLFSKEDIEGEDVHIEGYDIVFDVEYSAIKEMVEGEITTTSAQCSVCPEAPLVFEIDGAWFGIYMSNLSNISNLTVAFEAKGVDSVIAREWAQNISNQFNDPAVGNYRSGVYPAIPIKTIK